MNYNELQTLCQRRNMQIKSVTKSVGMTYTGLRDALNRDTLPVKKLVALCQVLNITPNEFVKWDSARALSNYEQIGFANTQNIGTVGAELLREQLAIKDEQINKLLALLNR